MKKNRIPKPPRRNRDPGQRGIGSIFYATPRNPAADNKEDDVGLRSLSQSSQKENLKSSCITVKNSQPTGRSETPESREFLKEFPKSPKRPGVRRGTTISPKKNKNIRQSQTSQPGRTKSDSTLLRNQGPFKQEEDPSQPAQSVSGLLEAVAPANSTNRISSPVSFVTASDGLSPSTTPKSPDTAPTTVSNTSSTENTHISVQSPQKSTPSKPAVAGEEEMGGLSSSTKESLKRPHPGNTSACPRVDEQKPNKRLRSQSASPEKTLPDKPEVVTIASSPPIWQEAEQDPSSGHLPSLPPTQQTTAAPPSSFLLPPPPIDSRESSAVSMLSRSPTPPLPAFPQYSSQRIESIKSSMRSMPVPSSQSDENAEPLDEPQEEDTTMILHDLVSDDDDELGLDMPSSTPTVVPGSGLHARNADGLDNASRASSPLSDYDSDASLEDLSILIPGLKPVAKNGKAPLASVNEDEEYDSDLLCASATKRIHESLTNNAADNKRTTRSATGSLNLSLIRAKSLAPVSTPKPQYKFSLSNLLKHDKREKSAQEEIERAKAVLAQDDDDDSDKSSLGGQTERQGNVLAGLVNDEDDEAKVQKVLKAMSGANAPQTRTTFHFCDVESDVWRQAVPEFPQMPDGTDANLLSLRDELFREQAFATGFARHLFELVKPPEALRTWLVQASIREPRAHLRYAYLECFLAICANPSRSLDGGVVEALLGVLAAKDAFSDKPIIMKPIQHPVNSPRRQPPAQLVHTVLALGQIISMHHIPRMIHSDFLPGLLELGTDHELMQDITLRQAYHQTFIDLLDNLVANSAGGEVVIGDLCEDVYNKIQEPHLQNDLIETLPCSTPLTHELRRRLALSFFLGSTVPCNNAVNSLNSTWALGTLPPLILDLLDTHDAFHITDNTCYTTLNACIRLLDAGIDCGFLPVFPLPISTSSADPDTPATPSTTSAADAKADLKAARIAHNASIDSLLQSLRRLNARIIDATALGDMAKTEAKGAIERLVVRLEYTVRVGGKGGAKMGGIWNGLEDGRKGGGKRGRESLDGWAVKREGGVSPRKSGLRRVKFEAGALDEKAEVVLPGPEQDVNGIMNEVNGPDVDPEATLVGTEVDPEATVVEAET